MARRKTRPTTKAAPARTTRKTRRNGRKTVTPIGDDRRIQARAYQIYLTRDNGSGSALGDWLQAERELKKTLRT